MYQVCEYKKASAGESLRRQKKRNGIVNLFWIFSLISIMLCFSVYLRFFSASLHSLILQRIVPTSACKLACNGRRVQPILIGNNRPLFAASK